jgi:hypothetical protein
MTFTLLHGVPTSSDTERPVPRWALRTAHAIPLMLLPVCLWRLPFAFHFEMGQVGQGDMPDLWLSIPYVFGLSVLSEAAALASLGLVRRWGEVVPAWLPKIGGRRVPPVAAIIPAVLAGLALTVLSAQMVLGWFGIVDTVGYSSLWWDALATACIAPMALWGPLLLALTGAYYVRRRLST